MFNYSSASLPPDATTESDCLFVGGPLHDEIQSISDDVPSVFLAADSGTHVYNRHDESSVFAHDSCTPEEVEQHIALVDNEPDLEAPAVGVLDYVSGMRDACEQILARFSCPACGQYN